MVYPELQSAFVTNTDELRPSEPGEQLVITEEDVDVLKSEVIPYWQNKQYSKGEKKLIFGYKYK